MSEPGLHEAEVEARWEAAPAVALVIALQVSLGAVSRHEGWTLWRFGWWIWLLLAVPELVLFATLALPPTRVLLEQIGHRRTAALALYAVISAANALALLALIASLLSGREHSGGQLLFKAATVWTTNVISFGLWFWAFDRGGPLRRRAADAPPPDFQFPQMENPSLAEPGWHARLVDYMYVSFTNAIAFSPTDAMPLTRRAKWLMLVEAACSAVTVLLVAARAVNILR